MSKIENKWDYLSEYEKLKAYDDLNSLIRRKKQKEKLNEKSVEKRIEDIKRDFPGVRI
ncbi:MAG: hypothetical protein ACFFDF_08050 [Candidatus Odinarchaeota archaeon]